MAVMSGDGTLIASLLFQRFQSVQTDMAKFITMSCLCVAVTENAQKSDDT